MTQKKKDFDPPQIVHLLIFATLLTPAMTSVAEAITGKIESMNLDILCLQETHLSKEQHFNMKQILQRLLPNYTLLQKKEIG